MYIISRNYNYSTAVFLALFFYKTLIKMLSIIIIIIIIPIPNTVNLHVQRIS